MRPPIDLALDFRTALGTLALLLAFLIDLNMTSRRSGLLLLGSGVFVLVMLALALRMTRTGRRWVAVALMWTTAVASISVSFALHATVIQRVPGWAEVIALSLMIALACRFLPFWAAALGALPPSLATLATDMRINPFLGLDAETSGVQLLLIFGFTVSGLYLRAEDSRRAETVAHVRRAERLDLARDLHDHVAHYMTGIVVQAQAGEQVAEQRPETARELFGNIERTGQQGLVAMSRMVKLLREDAADQSAPRDAMAQVRERITEFELNGHRASLDIAPDVRPEQWPTEIGGSVQRLVQEGLTNVRKHARGATDIQVRLEQADAELVVRVRNDGVPAKSRRFAPSGYGMIGLRERVTALGGTISSDPLPTGGWELVARIPHEARAA